MGEFFVLVFFAGCSFNLILQCGLGLQGIALRQGRIPWYSLILQFITVIVLWLFFTLILSRFSLGIFAYIVLFPLSVFFLCGLERLVSRALGVAAGGEPPCLDPSEGLCAAASFITLYLAPSFAGAFALALGFSLGVVFSLLVVREIGRRQVMEKVPRFIRGNALTLISLGLLSIILSSAAAILFS